MSFATVNALVPKLNEVLPLPSRIVSESTVVEVTSKVTVKPLSISTSSLEVGTYPHDHIPIVLQFPLLVAVHTAAVAVITGNPAIIRIIITTAAMNLFFNDKWNE